MIAVDIATGMSIKPFFDTKSHINILLRSLVVLA